MTQQSAPDSVMELTNCTESCKRSGCSDVSKCTCLENGIPCTDLCKCARVNCANVAGHIEEDGVESDDESDIEDFNVN